MDGGGFGHSLAWHFRCPSNLNTFGTVIDSHSGQ